MIGDVRDPIMQGCLSVVSSRETFDKDVIVYSMAKGTFIFVVIFLCMSLALCQRGPMTIVRPMELPIDHVSTFVYIGSIPMVSLLLLRKIPHTSLVPVVYFTGSTLGFLSRSYYYMLLVFLTRFLFDQEPPFLTDILKRYNTFSSLNFLLDIKKSFSSKPTETPLPSSQEERKKKPEIKALPSSQEERKKEPEIKAQ